MSRFYVSAQGQAKTPATRRGSTASGASAHVRGWNIGAEVSITAGRDRDTVTIYATRGTNGGGERRLIAQFDSFPAVTDATDATI